MDPFYSRTHNSEKHLEHVLWCWHPFFEWSTEDERQCAFFQKVSVTVHTAKASMNALGKSVCGQYYW
jgi:hypothetical protein